MSLRNQDPMAPIAVVGISCRLPGANSPNELWQFLSRAGQAWSHVPPQRFNEAAFYHPSADDPNGTNNHQGGHFVDADVRDFDSSFFRLPPQQAAAMDPQQRFLLEMSYEALENAGWSREHIAGSSTSVYTAMFTADYERNLYKDPLDLPTYYTTGTEKAILANRISHYFDLRGPSVTLDTACSGGLVALHQACQSLRDGESSASIVAAANLTLGPDHHIGMSNLHLIGGSGRSYPFDSRGTGYGRGEGLVVLALKSLDDALRDHDPVRAVISGTAVNQDGYTPPGITYPNGKAQAELIRSAYARSGLRPQDVAYIEAHGTGTVAGDTEELNALAEVFTTTRSLPLYVGSIKGNIGHTENTSGLASLVKAALILDHQQIPPVAGFANPKPGLPLEKMCIPTELVPLPVLEGIPPTLSINSFGFGGTNSHVIMRRGPRSPPTRCDSSPRLFVLSAHSQVSLKNMMSAHLLWLSKEPDLSLADLSYTLCHRRSCLNWRFGCVAEDRPSLMEKLRRGLDGSSFRPRTPEPYVIFVFTGQGAQWAGMGRGLLAGPTSCPTFQKSISASGDMLRRLGADWDLSEELLRDAADTRLNTASIAQPATTAIQIALVERLRAQRIRPRAVVGHSSGEIAAAYTAGRISHRTAMAITYHRGCVAGLPNEIRGLPRGAMMTVGLGEHGVAPFIKNLDKGRAGIACVNSPSNTTISGDSEAIDEIAARLAVNSNGIFHRRLMVDTAYHSHHMQVVAKNYLDRLGQLQAENYITQEDGIAFISSVSGLLKVDGFDGSYWTANLVSRVRFCEAIQTLVNYRISESSGRDALFVEIGPHNALSGPVRQTITAPGVPRVDFDYYAALQRKVDALSSTLSLASSLFERGVKFDMDNVTSLIQGSKTANVYNNLPSYPWDHSEKHWHESRVSHQYRMRPDPYHDLLGVRVADSTSIEPRWRHMVCLSTLPWLVDHKVDDLVVFPGSGYLCMAIEAMRQMFRERYTSSSQQQLETIILRNVSFHRALVVPSPPRRVEMQLSLDPQSTKPLEFALRITACTDGHWHTHCSGFVEAHITVCPEPTTWSSKPGFERQPAADSTIILQPQELYAELAEMGNTYGSSFTGIKSFVMTSDTAQAKSIVEITNIASLMPAAHQSPHLIHPTTLDNLLHTALPLVVRRIGRSSVMPTHIEELVLSATEAMPHDPGSTLMALTTLKSSSLRTSHADLAVMSSCIPVLTASGIEMRSLGATTTNPRSSLYVEGICYEIDWKPDPSFISTSHFPTSPTVFEDMVDLICFKTAGISVLEIGAGNETLSLAFIDAVITQGGRLASYDLVDTISQHAAEVQETLGSHCCPCSILDSEEKRTNSMLKPLSYDVILVSDPTVLARSTPLARPGGTLLAQLSDSNVAYDDWCAAVQGAQVPIEVQLTCLRKIEGPPVLVARPSNGIGEKLATNCCMLSHSKDQSGGDWARSLCRRLHKVCTELMTHSIDETAAFIGQDDDGTCFLVVEDQDQPILSDPRCFDAVVALLNQPARVIWVSPNSPVSMHQITGVARTAHAENYKLRLITIHADAEALASERLQDLVVKCMLQVMSSGEDSESYREREYWIRGDGMILIPRLHPSDGLNHVVNMSSGVNDASNIEQRTFADPDCPLVIPANSAMTTAKLFVQDHTLSTPLAADEVEIQTKAFTLSRQTLTRGLCEYIGVVSQVGTTVGDLTPGDRVMAVSGVTAASRFRISHTTAARIPIDAPLTCTAMLLSLMAASHALYKLAELPSTATVLLYDALSPQGRAAVSVALCMGIRLIVAATDPSQVEELVEHLDIRRDDVLVSRPSLCRQPLDDICPNGLDAIILTGETNARQEALSRLKPFGCVVSILPGGWNRAGDHSKLPPNAAVYHCNIIELLRYRPEHTAALVRQAAAALPHLRTGGSKLCTLDVHRTAEALRMIESGAQLQVVVTAQSESKVNTLVVPGQGGVRGGWDRENVSYVVAGGLGDLGQRLLLLMARRGAKHLVTLSRSLPSNEDRDKLQAKLNAAQPGCRLYCISCDLTSKDDVQQAAATVYHSGVPTVRGVIHSAAVLRDRPLNSMTYDDFQFVSKVKVDGTRALECAFGSPSLDFFIMLSSAANIVGTSGQANYNAGNAVQDALAQAHRWDAHHCRYISLNIGWIEDAVHTTNNDARISSLGRTGLRTIQSDELLRFFDYVLGVSSWSVALPQLFQATIGFDSVSVSGTTSHSGNIISPMFCHVRPGNSATAIRVSPEKILPTITSFEQVLKSGDDETVLNFTSSSICGQLARLVSVDASLINDNQSSILELGLDSLVAIELRNWLMRTFDAPLQSSEIMDDQTIRALGSKVISRSRLCKSLTMNINDHDQGPNPDYLAGTALQRDVGAAKADSITTTNQSPCLPPLPIPSLHDALRMFEESRRAVDSAEEQANTARHAQSLAEGIGPSLQQMVEDATSSSIADDYERHIYLERREPLQDFSEFTVGHPLDAPAHSQAQRAAIVTVAAAEFARRLAAGQVPNDTLHGMPVAGESRDWLFQATRRPGAEVDRTERHMTSSHSVIVLRRGHVFELDMPGPAVPLQVLSVQAAFERVLNRSKEPKASVCSLTAGDRKSWFLARSELESDPENAKILRAIDSAMFIICLDDESPMTSGERHTQFLLGGQERPFTNRWLDKPIQFAVTANGLSAGIFEHTKIDGLDVRTLHRQIIHALFADHYHSNQTDIGMGTDPDRAIPTSSDYLFREYLWNPPPAVLQRVEDVQAQCHRTYGYIDHRCFVAKELGLDRLHTKRVSPHSIAHLTALLAVYLVDKKSRSAWEIVSLGNWAGGRIDWIQTVSPAVRSFIEKAAAAVIAKADGIMDETHRVLHWHLESAAKVYSRTMMAAARGHGYVRHLYALLGAFTRSQSVQDDDKGKEVPAFFRTHAWNATRRGGLDQGLKIGFMPDGEDHDYPGAWDEGGFLMDGDCGVYIHCGIREHGITFAVSGHPEYVDAVRKALEPASSLMLALLKWKISDAL